MCSNPLEAMWVDFFFRVEDRPWVGSGLLLILFVKPTMSVLLMTWERMFGIMEGTLIVDS